MAEEQRRHIEKLMGRQGLLLSYARHSRDPGMTAPEVCKAFIVGTCPHDLFVGTKSDLGPCPNLHMPKYKLEYEYKTKKLGRTYPEIEHEYYQVLQSYVRDLDRTISVAQKRLEHTPEEREKISKVTADLDNLDAEIGLMIQELNYLIKLSTRGKYMENAENEDDSNKGEENGENGGDKAVSGSEIADASRLVKDLGHNDQTLKIIDLSIKLDAKCQERDEASKRARNIIDNVGQTSQQKLQVCDGCGAYLSRLDNDRRLADHFVGKIHLGFVQLRMAYEELRPKYRRA
ncbi:conserved hypothetical protein [Lodderomyces elongisporus NRRL YB-4239]|uniref:Uncharacterized protein n=1 Tax=Lodderomyces elongisporus (strain ATCC 11503 / CBS 2605 / JCM 1781 / NBRC 1676 / NRRL YB-4239) TaxID=379508 RepID=A5E3V9_LODEL|nr:conserved hypothetical protein [Lodderomyces elongisporus NRRL YB-4239]